MKRKDIISFTVVILMVLLSVLGMSRYENMPADLYGSVEIMIVFFVFALSALLITFGKTRFLFFSVGYAGAAISAVFAERIGFLFASVTALLLLHRYSGKKINKLFPVLALSGSGLCSIPFIRCLSRRLNYFNDDIEYLTEQNAHKNMTYKILLLLIIVFLVFCLIKSLRLPPMAWNRKGHSILFYGISLITALADISYCVCFTAEYISAYVLFSWLFFLLLIARDDDPVLGRLFPALQGKTGL